MTVANSQNITPIDLRALAESQHYRLTLDESVGGDTAEDRRWMWQIPGRRGHVWVHGANTLGVYCRVTRREYRDRLVAAGVTIIQDGDGELNATFPPDLLPAVAEIIEAKRRRVLTPEQREALLRAGEGTRLVKGGGKSSKNDPASSPEGEGRETLP
jgi:hypothetical protein